MRRKFSQRAALLKMGVRSGLEVVVKEQLEAAGVPFAYEKLTIPFLQPAKPRKYTPDFEILSNGIIVETKGRFETADRQKQLMVKEQYPDLEIRFVFSNPKQRISKQSQTNYAMWCESKGFKYAKGLIPDSWLREPPHLASLAALAKLKEKK